MILSDLLSEMSKVIQEGKKQTGSREPKTVDGYTVPRTGDFLTPQQNAFLAHVLKEVGLLPPVAQRLPTIRAKWEECRAEKGKRRQLKIEARRDYDRQYEASRRLVR